MAPFPLLPWLAPREPAPWCRTALSQEASLEAAVDAVARQLNAPEAADLALVFVSSAYASDLPRLLPLLGQRLRAAHWMGCVGGGVVGTDAGGVPHELEREAALSVTLLRLPGAELHPFRIDTSDLPDLDGPAEAWIERVGAPAASGMLLLVDPSSPAINDLISGLDYAYPDVVKVGGIAGQHSASHGSLLYDGAVCTGAVGCLVSGAWQLQAVVAQGCRPIGPVFEVEQAQRNVVLEVSRGERRNTPVAALQEILTALSPEERELVKHSLFLGVGRNSFNLSAAGEEEPAAFLVRNLIGVDPRNGAVAVAERMRVGQQVQFQLRDAAASSQELSQLLRRQAEQEPQPLAALVFACLGRGQGLYGRPDGDVSLCRAAFAQVPIAGAFCNGEIGPVGGTTHLHGYTASLGFLVPSPTPAAPEESLSA
ncbi:MAG: FIST N-terminal domain-containing protein [Synechococcus sp.]|nr:FIST N-terminal domain-containing protein [Synechococcus sp.]